MAIQDENNRSTEMDENKRNKSSTSKNEKTDQQPNFHGTRPYLASGGAPQQYGNYSQEAQPFSDPANEWQRVGQSSDQNWWESGTRQQQQAFRGEIGYPYRENYGERNQQAQRGVENLYPQEPASEQQRQNFAEGSQYPYEGGFGTGNLLRQGLERAKEWPDQGYNQSLGRSQDQQIQSPGWRQNQFRNQNQRTNQNPNTMRSDERNFRDDYNDYRDQEYRRDRNRIEDREYDYGTSRRDQDYDRRGFYSDREPNRGYEQDWDYSRSPNYDRRGDYDRDSNYNQYRGHNRGQYHSTETDIPGRGYDTEREMNRHANNYSGYAERDRDYDQRNRNSRRVLNNSVASSHRASGPYEDFERDLDRFEVRGDYQDRHGSYNRSDRDRDAGPSRNRGRYYRPEEDFDGRSRLSSRMRDRGLERSPSGNWGPSENEYNDRFGGGRGR